MVYLASYKVWNNKNSNWLDKIISIATFSNYSHSELFYEGNLYGISPRENKVRIKNINNYDNWDFQPLTNIEIKEVKKIGKRYINHSYSYLEAVLAGVPFLTLCFRLKNKIFCSYLVADVLSEVGYNIKNGCSLNPKQLRNHIIKMEKHV